MTPAAPNLRPGESRRAWAEFPVSATAPGGFTQVIAVREVCPPEAVYTPPPPGQPILFLTLHGRAETQVGPHTLAHQPGSLAAFASDCVLRERVGPEQPWSVAYLLLSGPWADGLDEWLHRHDPPALSFPGFAPRLRQAFSEMVNLTLSQPPGWEWAFSARCAEMLGDLYREIFARSPGQSLLERLAKTLDADPAARPSLPEMAAEAGLTPRQFLYQFGKAAGEPPAGWIQRRRIAHARRLLGQGESVTAVSDRLGYANPYHFSRVFKAVTGLPPSTVRDSAQRAWRHSPNHAL